MRQVRLIPTPRDYAKAAEDYAAVFGETPEALVDQDFIRGLAQLRVLVREYRQVAGMLRRMAELEPRVRGTGAIDVQLPNDPRYRHVVLNPETFLALYLQGEMTPDAQGRPQYTGTRRLRGE